LQLRSAFVKPVQRGTAFKKMCARKTGPEKIRFGLSCNRCWVMPLVGAISIYLAATTVHGSEIDDLIAQDKAISEANASLDKTYQKIMATLDDNAAGGDSSAKNVKDALVQAERAWIKWRDAEALMRAYAGGAVGGSALREDLHSALLDLINERQDYLQSLDGQLKGD
jgi:uncharacterized protein YecT (DUF1311 family)